MRLEDSTNPCLARLQNAVTLRIGRMGSSLCLLASHEIAPFGLYTGIVSVLETMPSEPERCACGNELLDAYDECSACFADKYEPEDA